MKIKQVHWYLYMVVDNCDDPPKNICTGQGEPADRPNSIPVLFLHPALQLSLAGLMLLLL
jgi:hypothetical protein